MDRSYPIICFTRDEIHLFVLYSAGLRRCVAAAAIAIAIARCVIVFTFVYCHLFAGCFALSLSPLLAFVALSCRCLSHAVGYFSSRPTGSDEAVAAFPYANGSSDLAHAFLVVESKVRIFFYPVGTTQLQQWLGFMLATPE